MISRIMLLLTIMLGTILPVQAALNPELKKMLAVMNIGTAFTVAPGFIVTNKHVVEDDKKVLFMRADESTFEGELVLDDPDNDLALFYVDPGVVKLKPIPFAKTQSSIGTQVFTIGFPHPSVLGISPKLTMGHINSERGFEDNPNTYQISVPLQSGNSGGPLFDMSGSVVGITSWKLNAERMFKLTGDVPQNVNYAVKVGLLKKLLNDIPLKWKTRAATAQKLELEQLVKGVINSVFIVLAGAKDLSKIQPTNLDPLNSAMFIDTPIIKQKIALLVYANPHDDQMSISGRRPATLNSFSDTVIKAIKEELRTLGKNRVNIIYTRLGRAASKIIYLPDKKYQAKSFCRRHGVDLLVSLDYESDDNLYRSSTFRVFDCESLYMYKQSDYVSHSYGDKFATDIDLRKFLRSFLATLPGLIHWVGR